MRLQEKVQRIKVVIFDVDGVLSDGKITYDVHGVEYKSFNVRDGHRIKLLQRAGYRTGIITGRQSPIVGHRARELEMTMVYQGAIDKLVVYEELKSTHGLCDEQIAYMGDDIIDIPVLRRVGLSACVPEAPDEVRREVDMITRNRGGDGAAAEFIEFILREAGHWPGLMERYQR
ncbi:HAD hydrolase family protein [Desulfurispirillum indicum]|uniref:3-deoxy-D-manno-octulosonate 8-phosphate phosphatase, YrbI family n=1 Tax=Desulfurispirillum indicum (strain ATCC BAA-1389 / DSM 22839 / S5) TaxID=653733 RepID=E6W104_DESIS|nr:HAD hydrolase family protein [Desulfurispirillum indicum]ADU65336.1 3-deoxy-D-manno-octulosonate 8-phosphate phosphatase, YrbI family [Desulfurispirillum indicum S5]UCZ57232.1 HAD hydrolase family protein [Desulfurispirillum indicum]